MNTKNCWWNEVPNAIRFLEEIVTELGDGKNTLLEMPEKLPWPADFYDQFEYCLERLGINRNLKYIEDEPDQPPGNILKGIFCKPERRAQFRPNIGYAAFLANPQGSTLPGSVVYVKDLKGERIGAWLQFVHEYTMATEEQSASFLLETTDHFPNAAALTVHSYAGTINKFDTYAFYMLRASSFSGSLDLRRYLAELAFALCENDAEMGGACLDQSREFMAAPIKRLGDVCGQYQRSDGSPFEMPNPHNALVKAIWRAQIRLIFPILEDFRQDFVSRHRKDIELCLPVRNSLGELIHDPDEVELGTLSMLAGKRSFVLTAKDFDKLTLYKDARNKLAHLEPMDPEMLFNILDKQ